MRIRLNKDHEGRQRQEVEAELVTRNRKSAWFQIGDRRSHGGPVIIKRKAGRDYDPEELRP